MDIQRNADPKKAEIMWDKRASDYPRYSSSEDTFEAKVLRMAEEAGVNLSGLRVLDVGSGSGKYTLRLAKKAASVTAADISGEMLRILREDAQKEGITNITTVHTDWEGFDSGNEKFDMVFCSTTPAVRTPEDFARVTELAGKFVVYLGFAGKKDSEIMNRIYAKCGITPKRFNDTPVLKKWLDEKGLTYKSAQIDHMWEKRVTAENMKRQCMDFLSGYDAPNAEKTVSEEVDEITDAEGMATDKTHALLELIIWNTK
ncbi:class I SAM-dependent methyltransferase [Geovibrio thiophilus]|uniref:Class I SAM-dependent methyltransferase n=1 Tax=Geovibrio thiophilus TaxID=139438 RepID=A0A3R6AXZ4_9BACT|nr:class I SAM-dependent methyltransferase [Geovibrio thiophilus]QAR33116.1 class I SAM-dependent methyltransferase [Geovibrio thiophilus]